MHENECQSERGIERDREREKGMYHSRDAEHEVPAVSLQVHDDLHSESVLPHRNKRKAKRYSERDEDRRQR